MSKKSFKTSLGIGTVGEQLVIKHFNEQNRACIKADAGIDFDLLLDNSITFEVKYDIMSAKTGNVAIEYWNSKKNKPSGITATKAKYWIHIFIEDDNQTKIFFANVDDLKKFTSDKQPLKIIKAGGDDNADLLIYKIPDIFYCDTSPFKNIRDFNE